MTSFLKVLYTLLALNIISYVAALRDNDPIYGKVQLSGKDEYGEVEFKYSLDKCIEQGYCLDDITTSKDFWDQIGTLAPSFLTDTFSALNNTFEIHANRGSFGKGNDWKIFLSHEVFTRRNKYMAMIIMYFIMGLGLFLVHCFKQRLSPDFQFKPSKLSKLMLDYLGYKTYYKIVYLVLVPSYAGDQKTIEFYPALIYMICEDYMQGQFTFALAVVLAMGYGTRRFKIDASMAWKTALLIACNILLTLPVLLRTFQIMLGILKSGTILESVWFDLPLTILYYGLISLCCYIGYNTYKINRDQRYLDSAKAIIIGILLNPFVVVPEDLWRSRDFMVKVVVKSTTPSRGMNVPELIELGVIIYLIYVWRDIRDEELGSIQSEKVET